jgi:hypothetical protein
MQTTDVATDIAGFRALIRRDDPYPILGPALHDMGIQWDVHHRSTHPPTAYLLVSPVAMLPPRIGIALWAWLMLAGIALSYHLLGVRTVAAIGLAPLTLLWPPAVLSLGQLTVLWLLGFALAHNRRTALAGAGVALAALTKLFPALILMPFLLARQWRALIAFGAVWVAALAALMLIHPGAVTRYIEVNRTTSLEQILRPDNASPVATAYRAAGAPGIALVLAFLALVWWVNRSRDRPTSLMLYNYLAVALLPIAWSYSALPLLPMLAWFMLRKPAIFPILSLGAILLCCRPTGHHAALCTTAGLLLPGACFILDAMLVRFRPPIPAPAGPGAP